jgi:MATE family multidrug resistance protein
VSSLLRELRPTLALALPIVVGQVSQMLMGVTDSLMIGRVGVVELAAASFTTAVFGLFYVVGIGLLLSVAVLVARAHGAGQPADCADFLRHGLALAVAMGTVSGLALHGLSHRLGWFGQPPEVVAVVGPYFRIIGWSLLPVLMYQVLRQYSEAMGHPWSAMVVLLLCVGLNALLNWVLIWGHLGAPALGLEGAGWATLIARVVALGALWAWLHHYPDLRSSWPARALAHAGAGWRAWTHGLAAARFREMLALGVPAAGQLMFESGAFTASALMMGWLGTVPLAAHQIAINCASAAFMVPLGLSIATSMRIGRAVGEGRTGALRAIGFGAIGSGASFMGLAAVGFVTAGWWVARAFTPDAAVVDLAVRLLGVAAVFLMVDGTQVIGSAALRGMADVRVPTAVTFVAYWLIAVPLGYGLAFRTEVGPIGVWIGLAAGLAFAAGCLTWRFHRKTAG